MKAKIYAPELFIYQSQVTSLYSVFNRVTGILLTLVWLGLFLLIKVLKLSVLNYNFYFFIYFLLFSFNFVVHYCLLCILFCFLFHFFVGIRHFIWDTGRLLDLDEVGYTSLIIISVVLIISFLILL